MKNFARIFIILFLAWSLKVVFFEHLDNEDLVNEQTRQKREMVIDDIRKMSKENRERIIEIEEKLDDLLKNQNNGKG